MSRPIVTAAVVAVLIVVAALVYVLLPSSPAPEQGRPAGADSDRGERALETIAELREDAGQQASPPPQTLDEVVEQADDFRADGQLADAQRLYFFAATEGHPQAAFTLGEMNDPLHHDPATSLMARPDAFQAYRWYSQARDGGIGEAQARLDALRDWAQGRAANDFEAERLLLQWE